ncbi:MAG TPA: hypothetical protein VFA95_11065 [Gammaproteobacteria bacterium]|nr:hypothetical protein [Gammaproteobacteria bacterium]
METTADLDRIGVHLAPETVTAVVCFAVGSRRVYHRVGRRAATACSRPCRACSRPRWTDAWCAR